MPLNPTHIEETFSSKEQGVKRLLSSILSLSLRQEENATKTIISIINRLISVSKTRKEGLEYLNLIVGQCNVEVISENALNWINQCIVKFPDDVLREIKLRMIGLIVELAHQDADFSKKFLSDQVSKVLENCLTTSHVSSFECKSALNTLTTCMKHYPSWFKTHKPKIQTFVLIFMDNNDEVLVACAARAFHHLQSVGNAADQKSSFTASFHKLCATVHGVCDKLFANEREFFASDISSDGFEFTDNPCQSSSEVLHVSARRVASLLTFLEVMIKTKYPAPKETMPKVLLDVIGRILSCHKCISDDAHSLEGCQFSILLQELQAKALKLLRLVIIWYQSNCLPFSYTISKLITNALERSHSCLCYKSDALYREQVYKVLSQWALTTNLHPHFQSLIIKCILTDITPAKTQVTLMTISEGKKSQKAKRRHMTERIIASGNTVSNIDTNATCIYAVKALNSLLEFTKLDIKTPLLLQLFEVIFDSLQCCHLPELYKTIVALYSQTTLPTLPPLQSTLAILARGSNDRHPDIRRTCQQGLRVLEGFCQPVCPSLYLGVDKEDEGVRVEGVVVDVEVAELYIDDVSVNDVLEAVVSAPSEDSNTVEAVEDVVPADIVNGGDQIEEPTTEAVEENSPEAQIDDVEVSKPETPSEAAPDVTEPIVDVTETEDEPAAKKAKVTSEDELLINYDPEDPDASFLEDDSFVDEVKDYY